MGPQTEKAEGQSRARPWVLMASPFQGPEGQENTCQGLAGLVRMNHYRQKGGSRDVGQRSHCLSRVGLSR